MRWQKEKVLRRRSPTIQRTQLYLLHSRAGSPSDHGCFVNTLLYYIYGNAAYLSILFTNYSATHRANFTELTWFAIWTVFHLQSERLTFSWICTVEFQAKLNYSMRFQAYVSFRVNVTSPKKSSQTLMEGEWGGGTRVCFVLFSEDDICHPPMGVLSSCDCKVYYLHQIYLMWWKIPFVWKHLPQGSCVLSVFWLVNRVYPACNSLIVTANDAYKGTSEFQ